jgi:4-hydroxybenzoate polyprenyltransferase
MSEPARLGLHDRLFAYLELVRLPNLFTSMADVTMGFLFVRGLDPNDRPLLILIAAASTILYAAGTTLNDVFDYRVDLEQRPERPIPSGRVSLGAARWLGTELLLLGLVLGWVGAAWLRLVWPGVVATLLAAAIMLYDAWLKRTPLGPLAMGSCRMLNVLLGMSVVAGFWQPPENWLVAGGIGAYVAGITWMARTEARRSNRLHLLGALAVMLGGIGLLASLAGLPDNLPGLQQISPQRWLILMGLLAVLIGWRSLWAVSDPRPQIVQMAVRQSILSIVMLDAAACFAKRDMAEAITVLIFLVPAMIFGQLFRST